jgi:HemX protein
MHAEILSDVLRVGDRILVDLALICFFLGSAYSTYSSMGAKYFTSRWTLLLIAGGFALLSLFLFVRGHSIGRCPITNQFELLTFMTWSMVLIYFVIGSDYRLSLMGAFTAPAASLLLLVAAFLSEPEPAKTQVKVNPWLEAHTSFSIVACGAFALACIAGIMYLVQERQLKARNPGSMFFRLPPINALTVANSRLLWLGFGLLTVGLATGFFIGAEIEWKKATWSILVWCLYAGILVARWRHAVAGKWIAAMSIIAFSLLLGTFFGIRFISDGGSY